MRPPGQRRWRAAVATTAVLAVGGFVGAPAAAAQSSPDPAQVGQWSAPFEEGGAGQPSCELSAAEGGNERVVCKPTAVSTFMLPTGNLLYWNGIESSENYQASILTEAPQSRDSKSRLLNLSSGTPQWKVPGNANGGGVNPNIEPGQTHEECLMQNPFGVAGVPGRPGDGFTGSAAGALGVPEQAPACSPDDVAQNDVDMFCADVAMLPDGRPLVVGGTDWYNEPKILERAEGDPADVGLLELEGTRTARTYDYATGSWSNAGSMKYGRWYPGLVTTPEGKVFAASGTRKLIKSTQGSQVRRTETYDPATDTWSENFTGPKSENTLPQNPRMFLAPNGKIFYTGSGQMWGPLGQAVDEVLFGLQQFFDLETKEWETTGATIPVSSPAETLLPMQAPYDEMQILSAGGVLGPPPGTFLATPRSQITTVTANGDVSSEGTGKLNNPRWFSSAVPMPDGKVMITGGANRDEVIFPGNESAVRMAEIFDPATGEWTEVGETSRDRTYHNSAVLLPDGRVLIGGHSPITIGYSAHRDGVPGVTANNDKDPSFEIYSPPYLFNGERPHIDHVQSGLRWGQDFTIETDEADEIEKVMLMRMPSPQHVYDSDARTLELPFAKGDGELTATVPQDGVAAPPGAYYLVIDKVGDDGENLVPSVARSVFVGDSSDKTEALEPMSGAAVTGGSAPETREHTYLDDPPRLPVEGAPQLPGADGAPGPDDSYEVLPGGGVGGSEGDQSGSSGPSDSSGDEPAVPALPEGVLGGVAPSGSGRRARCRVAHPVQGRRSAA